MLFATIALQAPYVAINAVACDYVHSVQNFQQNLLIAGLAEDPGIIATGIMRPEISVERILRLPPFVNALQKQNEAKEEYRRKLRAELMKGKATEVPDEGKVDKSKAKKQREPDAHPGLPSSGEEAF